MESAPLEAGEIGVKEEGGREGGGVKEERGGREEKGGRRRGGEGELEVE